VITCGAPKEIDDYWERLTAGGDPTAQVCGWLKDRVGLSWQVVPHRLSRWLADEKSAGAQRAMVAMLGMKKLDLAALQQAFDGS
jgi:predicted 3-demethylubiquinone-9 3-methyltransferase (glyoxalase superfamily)